MKIAICDDDPQDIESLSNFISLSQNRHEIDCFTDAFSFLDSFYNKVKYDLAFIDIQMPGHSGWDVAEEIKRNNNKVFVVFTTIYSEYIYDCFDRADWFLVKPLDKSRVEKVLNYAYNHTHPKVYCFLSDNIELQLLDNQIKYLEVRKNYLFLHTNIGIHKVRMTLKHAKSLLMDSKKFAQCHNSFLINLDYYDRIANSEVILKTGEHVPLSRTYKKELYRCISEFIKQD